MITVITPSRLHLGLIDLSGTLGRIDGGVGLALMEPQVRVLARRAQSWHLEANLPASLCQRAGEILERFRERNGLPGAHVKIERAIPLHVGLGAGTQLALGIARAIYALYDLPWNTRSVAAWIGRGGTSGIGVAAFEQGGFILDGGHAFPKQKTSFLPSSASAGTSPPPVLARYDFPPDWPLLLVTPRCRHIGGADEVRRFQTLCPLPRDTAERNCHLILMQLLPAILERDLRAFGEALNALQEIGWKRVEYEAQGEVVGRTRAFLLEHGAIGVGLSSWGPTLVAFGEDLERLKTLTETYLAGLPEGGSCRLTRANNQGARVLEHHGTV